jgi:hypothetical protein
VSTLDFTGTAGPDFQQARDGLRLSRQLERIRELMLDGKARTLSEIAAATGDPEASASAQLRHLRKERFGSYDVRKRHRGDAANGLYEYFINLEAPAVSPPEVGAASPPLPGEVFSACACGRKSAAKLCGKCRAVWCDAFGHEPHRCGATP